MKRWGPMVNSEQLTSALSAEAKKIAQAYEAEMKKRDEADGIVAMSATKGSQKKRNVLSKIFP